MFTSMQDIHIIMYDHTPGMRVTPGMYRSHRRNHEPAHLQPNPTRHTLSKQNSHCAVAPQALNTCLTIQKLQVSVSHNRSQLDPSQNSPCSPAPSHPCRAVLRFRSAWALRAPEASTNSCLKPSHTLPPRSWINQGPGQPNLPSRNQHPTLPSLPVVPV